MYFSQLLKYSQLLAKSFSNNFYFIKTKLLKCYTVQKYSKVFSPRVSS